MGGQATGARRERRDAGAPERSRKRPPRARFDAQDRVGNEEIVQRIRRGDITEDDLADLTPSQREWIRILRAIEAANPSASPEEIAMAISLRVWASGEMWDAKGESQYPGLIPDYAGGKGYRDVRLVDADGRPLTRDQLTRWVTDRQGDRTNLNHLFPAVAAQAGHNGVVGRYGAFMVTHGGDTLQNLGETVLGNPDHWSAGEYAGNQRALELAMEYREKGGRLSELLLRRFREENRE